MSDGFYTVYVCTVYGIETIKNKSIDAIPTSCPLSRIDLHSFVNLNNDVSQLWNFLYELIKSDKIEP